MSTRIVVFGTSDFGRSSFETIRLSPLFEIVAVVTQPARPADRNQLQTPTPIEIWATQHKLPVLTPTTLRDEVTEEHVKKLRPDLFVTAAYGLILPASLLKIPTQGAINIHASVLPAYRGASPIAAAIADGQTETGVSFILMDEGIDTGPVLASYALPILAADTTPTLEVRLSALAAGHLVDALTAWLAGTVSPNSQNAALASYASKLTRNDGRAEWTDAHRLARLTRAYHPWPGVWSEWHGQNIKFSAGTSEAGHPMHIPGTLVAGNFSSGWAICCSNGWFIPDQVQFAGRKTQPANTIPGSYPNWIGSVLT